MNDANDPLVLDLLEWIAREPRLYAEVIETWRTSCPRLAGPYPAQLAEHTRRLPGPTATQV